MQNAKGVETNQACRPVRVVSTPPSGRSHTGVGRYFLLLSMTSTRSVSGSVTSHGSGTRLISVALSGHG